ncbi:signal peptidase I [Paenibacillus alvei]|uniref:signal peptidase I n=1 Tax=Paenibacillus alvei TaxID=44250 RepID=UPI0018CC91D5|nr:signal peptidase I [Paenibacillus alvei]MBG9733154.1 signal peptidase I [Paenibacillus alvei]MBG9745286.1 signal peptidase I [Paenibacillus alvei]MCY9580560.1 signal peptidase I [Paenibacillus alvei]MCY9585044.1 signal peptidase I [Paenibacillus alvei]
MDQNDQLMQPNTEETAEKSASPKKNELLEWIKAIAIAVVLVVVVRWLLFAPFIVDGPSMEPNFWTGERLIVNKILYEFRQPKTGEVVVFHVPQENRDLIKRVIGVAGDTIDYRGDDLYVNGKKVEEPYIQEAIDKAHKNDMLYNDRNFPSDSTQPNKVPEGYIFVMGDHRSNSTDSRMLGFIPLTDVIGRADVIFWPISHVKLIQHH